MHTTQKERGVKRRNGMSEECATHKGECNTRLVHSWGCESSFVRQPFGRGNNVHLSTAHLWICHICQTLSGEQNLGVYLWGHLGPVLKKQKDPPSLCWDCPVLGLLLQPLWCCPGFPLIPPLLSCLSSLGSSSRAGIMLLMWDELTSLQQPVCTQKQDTA